MTEYIIALIFVVFCWIATYIISFIAIKKHLMDACFDSWYLGRKYDRLPPDRINDIISIDKCKIKFWVWLCWAVSSLFSGIAMVLIYFMQQL